MRTFFFGHLGLALCLSLTPFALRADSFPSRGLWIGDVTLNKVNETVVGVNAANQTVAPDPSVATPVAAPAHIRVILHVDNQGQVRLLKSVAVLAKNTNQPPDLALVTDPSLYPNFTVYSPVGRRISSSAFDFGDSYTVQILNQIAAAAASGAVINHNAFAAANNVVQSANVDTAYYKFVSGPGFSAAALNAAGAATAGAIQARSTNGSATQIFMAGIASASNNPTFVTNLNYAISLQTNVLFVDARFVTAVQSLSQSAAAAAASALTNGITNSSSVGMAATNAALLAVTNAVAAPSATSPGYLAFIGGSMFASSAGIAANAATAAAQSVAPGATQAQTVNAANAAALKSLTDNQIFAAADAVVVNQVNLAGTVVAGGSVSGSVFIGASHPTNPFRHRRHPDHQIGYDITRNISIQFDPVTGTNAFQPAGYGVDQLTGTYREEVFGLHKPLGTAQNIGLITTGTVTLDRISLVGVLNQ